MTADSIMQALREHPFVEDFRPEHVQTLGALAHEVAFERDHVIFREGDECSLFYLIVSGKVALEISAPGHTFRVQTLAAGDEFGWSAVLMRSGKHFQARALEPVAALAIEGAELHSACQEDPSFGCDFMFRLLGVVSERLQATRLQLLDIYAPKAKPVVA